MKATLIAILLLSAADALAQDKTTIAVMNVRGGDNVSAEVLDALSATIAQTLDELGPFKSISSREIATMLEHEVMKQTLGCDTATCLAEIGGALGADFLVAGTLLKVGETYMLQLQLTNIKHVKVESRVSREYSGGPKGLFDDTRTATKILMRDILALRSGTMLARVSEEGASIKVDGSIIGVSPMGRFEVAGGVHTLTVEKEGFVRFSRDVEIAAKKEIAVDVLLLPSEDFKKQYVEDATRSRAIAWSAIGVGGAGLVTSGVLLGVAFNKAGQLAEDSKTYNEQPLRSESELRDLDEREKSIAALDVSALVLAGVGAGALATGLVLLFTGDDPGRYEATTSVTTASISVIPGGLSCTVSF